MEGMGRSLPLWTPIIFVATTVIYLTPLGLRRSWTQPERDAKLTQLGVGLLGLVIADSFGAMPGLSAIVGIAVAMLVGAV